jgi:hypothetical protein
MADVISDYQKWKQQGENLKTQAKQAMEIRFGEALAEAVAIAEEYRADFGKALKPPPMVTAFRYKTPGKPKAKRPAKQPAAKTAAPSAPVADPKTKRIQRQLETARKKLEDAKAAGKPTRPLEDRIYEIEDALRLAATATH